jgi:hypothetical protein
MLDAEPLEVAAVQGGKLRPVKQQKSVVQVALPDITQNKSPPEDRNRQATTPWASLTNQETERGTVSQNVSPTDSMPGHYIAGTAPRFTPFRTTRNTGRTDIMSLARP